MTNNIILTCFIFFGTCFLLNAQPNTVQQRPMEDWLVKSQTGELLLYDEKDGLIPSILSQLEWDALTWETPLEAFNAYYNLRSFSDYQKISFTPQEGAVHF